LKRFALAVALVAVLAGIVVGTAAALRFTDSSCPEASPGGIHVCPAGVIGTPYSFQLVGEAGNGPPFTFVVKGGSLPAGLSLGSGGLISGTPTTAGVASFTVELQDNPDPVCSDGTRCNWCVFRGSCSQKDFSLNVLPGLRVTQESPAPGTVGAPYTIPLTASLVYTPDSTQPVTSPLAWSVSAGTPPPGLALGGSDGVLSGTPTTVGSYTFTVKAVLDAQRTGFATYTMEIRDPVVIAPLPLRWEGAHGSEVGVPLTATLSATGGTATFTWSLSAGALPQGVELGTDGTIAGTPKIGGKFPFTVQVADTEGRTATVNATLAVASTLSFKTLALRQAKVGRLYKAKLATLGGALPVRWTILRGTLPRGVHFAKKLGMFIGTPKREGKYRITVQVVDALGINAQKTLVLTVNA
jgi:hypothetical protein